MQGKLLVKCNGCGKLLETIHWDTADDTYHWASREDVMRRLLLSHRSECSYYGRGDDACRIPASLNSCSGWAVVELPTHQRVGMVEV